MSSTKKALLALSAVTAICLVALEVGAWAPPSYPPAVLATFETVSEVSVFGCASDGSPCRVGFKGTEVGSTTEIEMETGMGAPMAEFCARSGTLMTARPGRYRLRLIYQSHYVSSYSCVLVAAP